MTRTKMSKSILHLKITDKLLLHLQSRQQNHALSSWSKVNVPTGNDTAMVSAVLTRDSVPALVGIPP
jgi:hypothetical protein